MARLSVLQHDSLSRARINAALRGEHELDFSPRWAHLLETVSTDSPDGAIVDIYDAPERIPLFALRRFRQHHPGLAIVVYSDFEGRETDLLRVGRIGANGIVLSGRNDSRGALREAVRRALADAVASRVGYALRSDVRPDGIRVIRWAVAHAHEEPRVGELAAAFGVSPSGLNRALRKMGLPTAGRLLVWARLFRGAHALENPGRTVEGVAYQLGYSGGASFRRALKRCTGATPTRVSADGGLGFVLRRFRERGLAGTDVDDAGSGLELAGPRATFRDPPPLDQRSRP